MKKKLDARVLRTIMKKREQRKTFVQIAEALAKRGYVNGQQARVTWQNVRYFLLGR